MKKIVIIGGGFTGAYSAKRLQDDFDVTLIDKKEYFEFTPSILKVIVNPKFFKNIQICHRQYLDKGKFICGEVSEVGKDYVIVDKEKIKFDYLIIASGSRYNTPIKDPLVLVPQRGKEIQEYHDKLEKAKSIAIVGGGLVGVELAAEICCVYKDKEITLIQSEKSLIPRNSRKSSEYAEEYLKKREIKLILGEHASKKNGNTLETDKGKIVRADLTFMCVGITSNSEIMVKNFPNKINDKGQIRVNEFLQVSGIKNIFCGGDTTDIKEEKTAQSAEDHAQVIVKNIRQLEKGQELKPYNPSKKPFVIALGRHGGIFEYKEFIITGILAAIIKKFIEWKTMWRYR